MRLRIVTLTLLVMVTMSAARLLAADVTGHWTAEFETQVGKQSYTFDLVVKGNTLTGKVKGNLTGESEIQNGKIDGDAISFVENTKYQDMPLTFTYSGRVISADEIKLTRSLEGFPPEELVVKRAK